MVKRIVADEVKVRWEASVPPSPHNIIVLENATKQNGHLGNKASKIPVNKPTLFFLPTVSCFLLQGFQLLFISGSLIITWNYRKAIVLRISQCGNRLLWQKNLNSNLLNNWWFIPSKLCV